MDKHTSRLVRLADIPLYVRRQHCQAALDKEDDPTERLLIRLACEHPDPDATFLLTDDEP